MNSKTNRRSGNRLPGTGVATAGIPCCSTRKCSGSRHHHVVSSSCRSDSLISSVRRRNCPVTIDTLPSLPPMGGEDHGKAQGGIVVHCTVGCIKRRQGRRPHGQEPSQTRTPAAKVAAPNARNRSIPSKQKVQTSGRGLGKPLGKSPAPDRIQPSRDQDMSFSCWPGSGYFGTAPGGVLSSAEGPRSFQLWDPRPPRGDGGGKETGERLNHGQASALLRSKLSGYVYGLTQVLETTLEWAELFME